MIAYMSSLLHRLALTAFTAAAIVACSSADDAVEAPADETGEAVSESVPVGTMLRTTSAVNMREDASRSATSIKTVPSDAQAEVLIAAPKNGFYRVRQGGDEGWVFGRYLVRADDSSSGSGEYAHSKKIALVYQGSCSFLHRCDSYSRNLPAGQVNWGCLGHGAVCVDSEHWASGPSRAYCGKTVKFCKGDTCTTAVIKDVSVSQDFEGSQGVFDALGIGYGGGTTCANTYVNGDAHVTVSY
jgi:hypothetical protein